MPGNDSSPLRGEAMNQGIRDTIADPIAKFRARDESEVATISLRMTGHV